MRDTLNGRAHDIQARRHTAQNDPALKVIPERVVLGRFGADIHPSTRCALL